MKRKIGLWIMGLLSGIGALLMLGGNLSRANGSTDTDPNAFRYSNHDGSSLTTPETTTAI